MGKMQGYTYMYVNPKDLETAMSKVEMLIATASPKVTYGVAVDIARYTRRSGFFPIKSGRMRNTAVLTKDKFTKNGQIIGWVTPYARSLYFGKRATKRFRTTPEGKRTVAKVYKTGSRAFWDRPFTRNKKLMLHLYEKHMRLQKEFR